MTEEQKQFVKLIEGAAHFRSTAEVFGDAVHLMAQALWKPLAWWGDAEKVEADWQRTRDRYADDEYKNIVKAFGLVMEVLGKRREDFLGTVLEEIGASNTRNGQFLTPTSLARMMARVNAPTTHTPGEIVTLSDPACGASVLLIEEAEELLRSGVPQEDICIFAGDIDQRACDISYIQLSLLGFAAKVEHKNAMNMQEFSLPRYTAGYFFHRMPMRINKPKGETK